MVIDGSSTGGVVTVAPPGTVGVVMDGTLTVGTDIVGTVTVGTLTIGTVAAQPTRWFEPRTGSRATARAG